ncbi:DUF2147 domain-containing protein [Roseibium sp. SCP14]|uniref:DUF2147 domain-containing protein n=1 Tax=Roseibium sp. SCP14 TaxID=3141375 RepID=UPI00333A287F
MLNVTDKGLGAAAAAFAAINLLSSLPAIAKSPPEGFWLTEDKTIAVALGACEEESSKLCGIVSGLPGAASDAELARYKSQLCGLPVLWNLQWASEGERWERGKILDPETEMVYDLQASIKGSLLVLQIIGENGKPGETMTWQKITTFKEACW